MKTANETTRTTTLTPVETSQKTREHRRRSRHRILLGRIRHKSEHRVSPLLRKRRKETSPSDPGVASRHAFGTAPKYPTTHATCALAMKGMDLFCQTRVCQPGWKHQGPRRLLILTRRPSEVRSAEETTVIESSSGNFAAALAAFTHLVDLRFIP